LGRGDLVRLREAVGGELPEAGAVQVLHEQRDLLISGVLVLEAQEGEPPAVG
jgi:hypothetical protein